MEPEVWLAQLRASLPGGTPAVSDAEREALLDLARVAAHGSERWAAPLATFHAGVALGGLPVQERLEVLRRIVAGYDQAAADG